MYLISLTVSLFFPPAAALEVVIVISVYPEIGAPAVKPEDLFVTGPFVDRYVKLIIAPSLIFLPITLSPK